MVYQHRQGRINFAWYGPGAILAFVLVWLPLTAQNPNQHEKGDPGRYPRIALLDSGLQTGEKLGHVPESRLMERVSFVDGNEIETRGGPHGTTLSALIMKSVENKAKVYDVRVLPKSSDRAGPGNTADVIAGLDWVAEKSTNAPDVVNIGFAAKYPSDQYSLLHYSIRRVFDAGITIIAPAGNYGEPVQSTSGTYVPAAYPETLTVSTVERESKTLSRNSNYGKRVDLAGPPMPGSKKRPGDVLETSVSAAAASGVALRLLQNAFRSGEYDPSPRKVMWEMVRQGNTPSRGWNNDQDGITEPFLPDNPRWTDKPVPEDFHQPTPMEAPQRISRPFKKQFSIPW